MASINDIRSSRFLKKEDVGDGVLVTVRGMSQENVAQDGAEAEIKWTIHFNELEKPMVLNSTNAQIIALITGHSEDIEKNWIGAELVLYNEPNITFAGKLVGGIRVRAPKKKTEKDLPF